MNKRVILSVVIILLVALITGCNNKENDIMKNQNTIEESLNSNENSTTNNENTNSNTISNTNEENTNTKEEVNMSDVKILINDKEYSINLENNETVKELIKLLPLDITMRELNGNEKYIYLDNTLTSNSSNPKHINSGDVMLYGNNCLVIFYKSFDTSYSYTKIGHIDNLPNLGSGDISVKIEK